MYCTYKYSILVIKRIVEKKSKEQKFVKWRGKKQSCLLKNITLLLTLLLIKSCAHTKINRFSFIWTNNLKSFQQVLNYSTKASAAPFRYMEKCLQCLRCGGFDIVYLCLAWWERICVVVSLFAHWGEIFRNVVWNSSGKQHKSRKMCLGECMFGKATAYSRCKDDIHLADWGG